MAAAKRWIDPSLSEAERAELTGVRVDRRTAKPVAVEETSRQVPMARESKEPASASSLRQKKGRRWTNPNLTEADRRELDQRSRELRELFDRLERQPSNKPKREPEPFVPVFKEKPWLPWPESAYDKWKRLEAERKAKEAAGKSDDEETDSDT
ncbi:MAG: hypothetical protein AAF563_12340 [Pseudomonadota bacterium]